MIKHIFLTLFLFSSSLSLHAVESPKSKVSGSFTLAELNVPMQFEILGANDDYTLKLSVVENGKNHACSYKVQRISAPQQTRGRSGNIYSKKSDECQFALDDKELAKVLSNIMLIDVTYRLNESAKIFGSISLYTSDRSFQGKFSQ